MITFANCTYVNAMMAIAIFSRASLTCKRSRFRAIMQYVQLNAGFVYIHLCDSTISANKGEGGMCVFLLWFWINIYVFFSNQIVHRPFQLFSTFSKAIYHNFFLRFPNSRLYCSSYQISNYIIHIFHTSSLICVKNINTSSDINHSEKYITAIS